MDSSQVQCAERDWISEVRMHIVVRTTRDLPQQERLHSQALVLSFPRQNSELSPIIWLVDDAEWELQRKLTLNPPML